MAERESAVFVQIEGEDVLAGQLWSHRGERRESATFAYARDYLQRGDSYALDPGLPKAEGPQQTPIGRALFGAFTDCAPDRWGRRLITRREEKRAEREAVTPRSFGECDYLLGVHDDLRQGALRFAHPESKIFLATSDDGVPPLLRLPELLSASESLERDTADEEDLRTLLRAGSSLGGARPKAHILGDDGVVGIAKFPSVDDEWQVIRWEAVGLELARQAGLTVPEASLTTVADKAVLILDRFDRDGAQRIGYVSAMTMLEADDGDSASYVDIAEVIEVEGARVSRDLEELWRRIAFSILISNTDDHLRNHGFLRTSTAGWTLSPAFDLNPNPVEEKYLSTAIKPGVTAARLGTLMEVASLFRLSDDRAVQIVREVANATSRWQHVASRGGLSRSDIHRMAPAFEHEQRRFAERITDQSSRVG